ncbi:MAG: DUF3137 domain-containing protein [Alphaproteobacteria bacterium]
MIDYQKDIDYINLKHEFDNFYVQKLLPILRSHEKVRLRYLTAFAILVGFALLFYPAIIKKLLESEIGSSDDLMCGIYLGLSCIVIMMLIGPIYMYKKRVKPQIMPDFANFFGSFYYQYEGTIPDPYLMSSDLFDDYNQNIGDDFFSGTYEDVRITIAEEKLRFVKVDMNNHEMKKKVFSGICILFEMNKPFKGRTVVLEDHGLFNAFHKVKGLQNVKLEDSLFEKYFEVYSDSQIESRYLLTTGFMERMIKLRDLYDGKSIQFSFRNNTLLLAIPTKQDMFEANSFFRSNINKNKVDIVFEQFYTIFSIVKLLKLNQRIGM